jgi:hypothetical protein
MGVTAHPRLAVVFLMIVTVCLSLGLPAEDVLDAVYDESEALPYEVIPLFSIALRPAAFRTTQAPLNFLDLKSGVPSPYLPARVRDKDATQSANTRVSLALLCTLLC